MRTLNADQLKSMLSMESSLGHIHTLADAPIRELAVPSSVSTTKTVMNAEFPRLSTSIGGRKGKCSNRRAEREQKMNLIREVLSDQTVTAVASIILIVAALPMAGWSWAVNQMAGKSAGRKKEGT